MTEPIDIACGNAACNEQLYCGECGQRGQITYDRLLVLAQEHITPLPQEARDLLDQLIRTREHETHRLAREDYLHNGGRNWREFYDRHSLELHLRERFSLPDHPFGDCCEPSDDFHADVAALGITTHGVDVAAAEGISVLETTDG